jgi:hypothetical protein
MNSLNSSGLLHSFLFHLRTPLSSIKDASQVANQMQKKIPVSVFNWLEKWKPAVDRWISAEEKAHSFKDGEGHDWKQIVFEMAENMKDLSIAFDEAKALEMPESADGKMVFELASHAIEYLNNIIQPILSRDYQHLISSNNL